MSNTRLVPQNVEQRVAILVRSGNHSPLVLARSLKSQLDRQNCPCEIIAGIEGILGRKLPLLSRSPHRHLRFHYRVINRLCFYAEDAAMIRRLRGFTHFVFSETIPNPYWRNYYAIEQLRRQTGNQPIAIYDIFYLSAAPHYREQFMAANDHLEERFDFHFAISETSYTRKPPGPNEAVIGLNLADTSTLRPEPKREFVALVDFKYPGNEKEWAGQIAVLKSLGIKTIVLEGRYSVEEIRSLYQQARVMFLQHYESFGVPIAECLATGAYIFTPDPAFPMAFRREANPQPYKGGVLPEIFRVYSGESALRAELARIRSHYDPALTPLAVFKEFTSIYPHFFHGNSEPLMPALAKMRADVIPKSPRC